MSRKVLVFLFAISLSLIGAKAGLAGEETSGDYLSGIGTKFGRGLSNVVTSPLEIPCGIAADMSAQPDVGFFTGFGKGTVFMLRRILVGVCEVGTFMIPAEATIPPVCKASK